MGLRPGAADGERHRLAQALPDDAVTLGDLREPLQGGVVRVRVELGDDGGAIVGRVIEVVEEPDDAPARRRIDPLEPLNRQVYAFNEGADQLVVKPVATLYREGVPDLVRTGINNFFSNLGDAWSAVNSALQLRVQDAAENLMRFSVNSVFGLAGVLDIASEANIDRHPADFGSTLARWGVPVLRSVS